MRPQSLEESAEDVWTQLDAYSRQAFGGVGFASDATASAVARFWRIAASASRSHQIAVSNARRTRSGVPQCASANVREPAVQQTSPWKFLRSALGSGSACVMRYTKDQLASIVDSDLRVWDLRDTSKKPIQQRLQGRMRAFDVSANLVATGTNDAGIQLYDLDDPRAKPSRISFRNGVGSAISGIHWLGSGRVVASFCAGQHVSVADIEASTAERLLIADKSACVSGTLPLDENTFAVTVASTLHIWDLRASSSGAAMSSPIPFITNDQCFMAVCGGDWRTTPLAVAGGAHLGWIDLRSGAQQLVNLPAVCSGVTAAPRKHIVGIASQASCLAAWLSSPQQTIVAAWHPMIANPLAWAEWDGEVTSVAQPSGSVKRAETWSGLAVAVAQQKRNNFEFNMCAMWPQKSSRPHEDKATASFSRSALPEHQKLCPEKLRTVEDVLSRLRHDNSFATEEAIIGYEDRFLGPMEISLQDYDVFGDIPHHRVWYVRLGKDIYWDRRRRFDLFFNSGDTPIIIAGKGGKEDRRCVDLTASAIEKAQRTAELVETGVIRIREQNVNKQASPSVREDSLPVYKFVGGEWCVDHGEKVAACTGSKQLALKEELRVITLNVLFELPGDAELHTQERTDHVLQEIRSRYPDMIALQEVTPGFAQALLCQPWVQESYWSSISSADLATVTPHGNVLLVRYQMTRLRALRWGVSRFALLAVVEFGDRQSTVVSTVHLKADRSGDKMADFSDMRASQLNALEKSLGREHWIVLGDFNTDDVDASGRPPGLSLPAQDAWMVAQGDKPGITYDPETNILAKLLALQKRPRRLDRVLVHTAEAEGLVGAWHPESAEVAFSRQFKLSGSGKPWNMSDHFGVQCTFSWKSRSKASSQNASCNAAVPLRTAADVLPFSLLKALQDALGGGHVMLLGSAALGTDDETSDIDVLCCGCTRSRDDFFTSAADSLQSDADVEGIQIIADAVVPLLRCFVKSRMVEIQYSFMPSTASPVDLSLAEIETMEPISARGINAYKDVVMVWKTLHSAGGSECFKSFQRLAKGVKAWAHQRRISGTAFGYFGGFVWTLLAAAEVLRFWSQKRPMHARELASGLQESFFRTYAAWPWPAGVGLEGSQPGATKEHCRKTAPALMPVWCPTPPYANAARGVTASTRDVLVSEFKRASSISSEEKLLDAALPHFDRCIVAVIRGERVDGSEEVLSKWLEQRTVTLLLSIEQLLRGHPATSVRPVPRCKIKTLNLVPCVVLGVIGDWAPTSGEQRELASAMQKHAPERVEVEIKTLDEAELDFI
eukprot:TRINITY_DN65652_c0_g1_i1.p1 TRINITY_DN65652_c0_g1~~TRINITY_DN65652_c0_g1_i1.p1  ORF type:complete len:1288 (+),score=151.23 TRINITY_DN65652_c0_g1_i1:370-4233(+)